MPTADRKLHVFLCHASQDKPVVRELYQRLLAEAWIDPWLDKEKLLPGQEWDLEIQKAVEDADVVIVCLSGNSVTKEGYIQKELRKVLDVANEKPEGAIFIVPLRLDDCQTPRLLEKLQRVDYFPPREREVSYQRLVKALKTRAEMSGIPIFTDKIPPNRKPPASLFALAAVTLMVAVTLGYKPLAKLFQPDKNTVGVREEKINFEKYILSSGTLPENEARLFQMGAYGVQRTTIRHTYDENGTEIAREPESATISPVAEILLVGTANANKLFGKLAYIAKGNAWIMEGSTNQTRQLTFTEDLDSRIFTISDDGAWLLFTRKSAKPPDKEINTLWMIDLTENTPEPIDLNAANIINFASFIPGRPGIISYSTVEPRSTAPGWEANNDLIFLEFDSQGKVQKQQKVIADNPGGVYGQWGTSYTWSTDGFSLAYSRPDEIGLVDVTAGTLQPHLEIIPYHTDGDWALIPPIAWGTYEKKLFAVTHAAPSVAVSQEDSPFFDLSMIQFGEEAPVQLATQTGMFAYTTASPPLILDNENTYLIASLQAIFPTQSETSRYDLVIMTSDGSDKRRVFPMEGLSGIDPQTPVWMPAQPPVDQGIPLAIIYAGDIWFINIETGEVSKITNLGLVTKIDWR